MRSSKTERKTSSVTSGCVASSAVLLKPNVANILLFNFCEQKFVQHDPITIAIDCNGLSLLIFRRKMAQLCLWSKIRTKQWLVLGGSAFQCMRAGFLWSKCNNFVCLHTRQDQNELHLKRCFFFAKISIFCKSIAGPLSAVNTIIFVRREDKTNYLSNQT